MDVARAEHAGAAAISTNYINMHYDSANINHDSAADGGWGGFDHLAEEVVVRRRQTPQQLDVTEEHTHSLTRAREHTHTHTNEQTNKRASKKGLEKTRRVWD